MVVTEPVLYGNASSIDIPTGKTITLNLSDPDSLTIDGRGNIVLNSQADSEADIHSKCDEQSKTGWQPKYHDRRRSDHLDDTAFAPSA